MKFKLGQKVKCHSYIKKTGNWIKKIGERLCYDNAKFKYPKEIEYSESVVVNEIVKKDFEGFICGMKKKIHKKISCEWYCGVDIGFGDMPDTEKYEKFDYVECYEVCLEHKNKTWGKRYVPICDIEVINND